MPKKLPWREAGCFIDECGMLAFVTIECAKVRIDVTRKKPCSKPTAVHSDVEHYFRFNMRFDNLY
jgi:hypothetical protein